MLVLCAYMLEAGFGYPHWLYAHIRHPVVWMGTCITLLERNFNHLDKQTSAQYLLGGITLLLLLAVTLAIALLIGWAGGILLEILAMASLLATRSLYDHVRDVLLALRHADIETARIKVGHIVGRNTAELDAAGINRAAIESLAESFSDGVVAPLFWAVCFGLPGIACYKAINTADSMIGHKDTRYHAFGWAAARMDDLANIIPARISGGIIALVAASRQAWRIAWRDAGKHASPNAGWPEAAMAGALGIQLGGTNMYDGVAHAAPLIGEGTPYATSAHLQQALRIYLTACVLLLALLVLHSA